MGQNIDPLPVLLTRNLLDEIQAVLAYHPAMFCVLLGNRGGRSQRDFDFFLNIFLQVRLGPCNRVQHFLNGPCQIHRGRPSGFELCGGVGQMRVEFLCGNTARLAQTCFKHRQGTSHSQRSLRSGRLPAHACREWRSPFARLC